MAEENRENQEYMIPKHRLDQESERRREAERRLAALEKELAALKAERESEEEERAKKRGEFERIAERERKRREQAEAERDAARQELVTYRRRVAWSKAARGIVADEAIDDAFGMLSPEELERADLSDAEQAKALAQALVERKPYLAPSRAGASSGGSERPLPDERTGVDWREIKRKNRRPVFS